MFSIASCFVWILIICQSVSGNSLLKAVNSEITFSPGSLAPSTTSIIWKHIDNGGTVVKVIEWDGDDGSTDIPNPKFRSHASLNKDTGDLTLRYLQLQHSGVYTVDINSKEQRKQFTLTVMEPVRKPYISSECSRDEVPQCLLTCEGNAGDSVIWRNSAGQMLFEGQSKGTISVSASREESDTGQHFICTLRNAVSEETSDPVNVRDLFTDSRPVIVSAIVIPLITLLILLLVLIIRKTDRPFDVCHERQKTSGKRRK